MWSAAVVELKARSHERDTKTLRAKKNPRIILQN